MSKTDNPISQTLQQCLHVSSDAAHERAKQEEAKRAAYRRQYWQQYRKRMRRVFGTISNHSYDEIKAIADQNGRNVWEQIWLESCAYRARKYLPSGIIAHQQSALIREMRQIGNNLNQLARQGHIRIKRGEGLYAPPDDAVAEELLRHLLYLEGLITAFTDFTRDIDVSETTDDH